MKLYRIILGSVFVLADTRDEAVDLFETNIGEIIDGEDVKPIEINNIEDLALNEFDYCPFSYNGYKGVAFPTAFDYFQHIKNDKKSTRKSEVARLKAKYNNLLRKYNQCKS